MTDNTIRHTDIKSDGWIGRYLPEKLHPYVYLARLDRPIGIWLLLLPGWWAIILASGGARSLNFYDIKLLILFAIGAVVMRAAGCVVNDLWDRKLDALVERTMARPLAAGTVGVKQAFLFLFLLLLAGLWVLLQIPSLVTVLLGILALPMIALYPLMKRLTWWPQLFLGMIFNFGALMGWSAVSGVVDLPSVVLYLGAIFWTLGYDTIYAHQDKEDDMRIGIKSTALKLGVHSKKWLAGFYAAAWLLILGAFIIAQAGILSVLVLLAAAAHFYWQINRLDINDPQSALDIFRSNRDLGLIILAAALI
mgnify:CR=1 FL=1